MKHPKLWILPAATVVVAAVALAMALPGAESPPAGPASQVSSDDTAVASALASETNSPTVPEPPVAEPPEITNNEAEVEAPRVVTPPGGTPAPEFRGIQRWLNTPPLTLTELRGKVVLVDFWTYSCINCQRTLPYVRDWHDKYADRGLVVVGVHAPEFEFEKDLSNVQEALTRLGVTWPVATDNDFRTWRAYENRWWPHAFLIDREGRIRYHHIGEGAYEETELHIRNLLTEAGYPVADIAVGGVAPRSQ